MAFQRITIEGNVGADPRITTFADGQIAQFNVAVIEKAYTTSRGMTVPEHTEWFYCMVRNRLVQVIQPYVHKGDRILVSGKLRTREYTDKNNVQQKITELIVDALSLIGSRQVQQGGSRQQPKQYDSQKEPLPF